MAKDANEETKTAPKKETAPKTVEKKVATYNQDEPEMIKVKAAEGTQMYDPVSRNLYTADEPVEVRANDQFVVTNLERGKLKKAK